MMARMMIWWIPRRQKMLRRGLLRSARSVTLSSASRRSYSYSSSSSAWRSKAFPSWAAGSMAAAAAASIALLPWSEAKSEAATEVFETETGCSFPVVIRVPPAPRPIIQPWKGSKAGYIFQMGPDGLGYYPDRFKGGINYAARAGTGPELGLVGVGMRCMLQRCDILIARAYAIGMYVEDKTLRGGDSPGPTSPKVNKTLRLVMAREVKGGHIGKGFDRTLIPKLRSITGEKQGSWKGELRRFTRAFSKIGAMKVGAEVLFSMPGDDTITIYVDGVQVEKILSAALCQGVSEMYMGDTPVAPLVKTHFLDGFRLAYEAGLRANFPPPGTRVAATAA